MSSREVRPSGRIVRVAAGGLLSDQLLDPGEAQKALRLSPRSLDKLDALGILPKIRIPGLGVIRYRVSDVERLITGHPSSPEAP